MFGRKTPSFYEDELNRLKAQLQAEKPGTDEYNKVMAQLKDLIALCGKEKENKQFLDKAGRGNILGKVVGFLGLGGLAFGLARFEKAGNIFSGSSSNVISGIVKIGTRFFG